MPRTSCLRCEGDSFEVQQLKPQRHDSTGLMVQCSKCGAPVTFLDTRIRDNQMNQLEEVVNEMKRTVGEMSDRLGGLDERLMARK